MKIFRHIFALILISALGAGIASAEGHANKTADIEAADRNENSTFYLLRHAEKLKGKTKDPHLSQQGKQRANYLAQHLSLANITHIYSTDYNRTQETAKPLADLLGLKVQTYNASKLEDFANTLKSQAGQVVIVGHSNTTPGLTGLLSGQTVEQIEETEYDNLYQVVLINDKAQLTRFKIPPMVALP